MLDQPGVAGGDVIYSEFESGSYSREPKKLSFWSVRAPMPQHIPDRMQEVGSRDVKDGTDDNSLRISTGASCLINLCSDLHGVTCVYMVVSTDPGRQIWPSSGCKLPRVQATCRKNDTALVSANTPQVRTCAAGKTHCRSSTAPYAESQLF